MFDIQSDVPMAKGKAGRPPKYPFHKMNVGDSFFMPCDGNAAEVSRRAWDAGYRRFGPGVIGTRIVTNESGERGVRVWRKK